MRVQKIILGVAIVAIAIFGILKTAGAWPVGVVVVGPSVNQQCVDTCLAYNGYTADTYSFCQSQCMYPGNVVIEPGWVGGIWYPHGYRHFEPRHDGPHFDHNHGEHGFHRHTTELERGI